MNLYPKGTKPVGEVIYFEGRDYDYEAVQHLLIVMELSDVLRFYREHGAYYFKNSFDEVTPVHPGDFVVILTDGSVTTYDDFSEVQKDYEVF